MTTHALLSPSSAVRWLACPAAPLMEQGRPDEASPFAAEGTAAHEAAAIALLTDAPVTAQKGMSDDDLPAVQSYVDLSQSLCGQGAQLFIEQELDISPFTGEEGAKGTADAIIVRPEEIIVIDLKFGRGVRVDAEQNPQLMLYAAAAQRQFDAQDKPCRLVVHQPRINHVSEWVCSVEEMQLFLGRVSTASGVARSIMERGAAADTDYNPCESACRFCRARAVCPALTAQVQQVVGTDFDAIDAPEPAAPTDAEAIARALPFVPLIEAWCRAVTTEAERLLTAGEPVAGYKLVQGRKGNRAWTSAADAEAMLKTMKVRADDMYERRVISPAAAEKLAKAGTIGKRQWPKLQALITRAEGKPTLAPESDPRPAWHAADDFEKVEG